MGTEIRINGAGTFGHLQPGWLVNEDATPVAIGDYSGAIDSGSLSLSQGEDSEFLISEHAELTHDDLGSFFGHVSTANSNGATEATDTNIPLSMAGVGRTLTAERTAVTIPGIQNIVSAGDVLEDWQSVTTNGLIAVEPWSGSETSVYRVEQGVGSTVDILKVTATGARSRVTITGTNSPTSYALVTGFTLTSSNFVLFYTLSGVRRLGFFSRTTGAVVTVIGSNGTGNSQFGALAPSHSSPLYFHGADAGLGGNDNLYVLDYGNNRVQRFSAAGAYVAQFASTQPTHITGSAVPRYNSEGGVIYISSNASELTTEYRSTGTTTGFVITTGSNVSSTAMTPGASRGGLLVTRDSQVDLYNRKTGVFTNTAFLPEPVGVLVSTLSIIYTATSKFASGDHRSIHMLLADQSSLYGAFAYYAALGGVNSISYQMGGAVPHEQIPMMGWTDSPWNKIKELTAAFGVEVAVVEGILTVRPIGTRTLDLDAVQGGSVSLSLSTQQAAKAVSIECTGAFATTGDVTKVYTLAANESVATIRYGNVTTFSLEVNGWLSRVEQPIFGTGTYADNSATYTLGVTDTDGVLVTGWQWVQSGASISARIDPARPSLITVTIVAPALPITGTNGEYVIGQTQAPFNIPFHILGSGVMRNAAVSGTIDLLTGAGADVVASEKASDVTNPFIASRAQAYDRGIWRSEQLNGVGMQLSATIPTSALAGYGLTAGSLVTFKECIYRITGVTIGNAWTSITANRFTRQSDVQAIYGGRTMGQIDTFWAGTKYKDQIIKPLRDASDLSPYGAVGQYYYATADSFGTTLGSVTTYLDLLASDLNSSPYTNVSAAGRSALDGANVGWGTSIPIPYSIGPNTFGHIAYGMNPAAQHGTNILARTAEKDSLELLIWSLCAESVVDNNTWTRVGASWSVSFNAALKDGSAFLANNVSGHYATITPPAGSYVGVGYTYTTAGGGSVSGTGQWTRGGSVIKTNDTTVSPSTNYNAVLVPRPVRLMGMNGSTQVRVDAATGQVTYVDSLIKLSATPPWIVIVKPTYVSSTALYNIPKSTTDAYRADIDSVVALVSGAYAPVAQKLIVVDPVAAGWDAEIHTSNDGVHPNALGAQFLKDATKEAIAFAMAYPPMV